MTKGTGSEDFWNWFGGVAVFLADNIEDQSLLQELDRRVRGLDPRLSWEVGPGTTEAWQLVISPNLDPDLRSRAREIISTAPVINGWEFYAARRPKHWDYKLVMERSAGETLELDASNWTFVLLQYPNGSHEVLLHGNKLPALDAEERWQAAAMVLEGILGEEVLMDVIHDFELVDRLDPQFAEKQKPIQRLRETVLGM